MSTRRKGKEILGGLKKKIITLAEKNGGFQSRTAIKKLTLGPIFFIHIYRSPSTNEFPSDVPSNTMGRGEVCLVKQWKLQLNR